MSETVEFLNGRYLPVVGSQENPISCSSCPSACCQEGTVLALDAEEAEKLRENGTRLEPSYGRNGSMQEGGKLARTVNALRGINNREYYKLLTPCGNLIGQGENSQCRVWGRPSPERPVICGQVPVGGFSCRAIRSSRGVDSESSFQEWLRQTQC